MARLTKLKVAKVVVNDTYSELTFISLDPEFPGSFEKNISLFDFNEETKANDIENPEKAAKVEAQLATHLKTSYAELAMLEGAEVELWIGDAPNFVVYYEDVKMYEKFPKELKGKTLKGCIVADIIHEPTKSIRVIVEHEGKEYAINYRFEKSLGDGVYVFNNKKAAKSTERFMNQFEITSMDEIADCIGKQVHVGVEMIGVHPFGEIKAVL